MMLTYFTANGISRRIRSTIDATKRIAVGDFSFRIIPDTKDEVGVLAEAVSSMTARLQSLLVESMEKVKLQNELHTAEIVQHRFLPSGELNIGNLQIHQYYLPANFCSGEWWGHFQLSEGVEMICIADVVGHGVASVLVTAMTHSYLATVAHRARTSRVIPGPAAILTEFNEVLNGTMKGFMTATCFVAIFDLNEGHLSYSNGGHNSPYFLSQKGATGSPGKQQKTLNLSGTPVGVVPDGTFKEKKLPINPGHQLILYTDGLIECRSPNQTQWSKANFLRSLAANSITTPETLLKNIVRAANAHFDTQPLDDDITVVIIEVSPNWIGNKASTEQQQADGAVNFILDF